MSMMCDPMFLDPRTRKDIEDIEFTCGCEKRKPRWSICDYHEGYEAAIERHGSGLEDE